MYRLSALQQTSVYDCGDVSERGCANKHYRAQVNLFTRPRRFGKSLNMSMLKSFLSWEEIKAFFVIWKYTAAWLQPEIRESVLCSSLRDLSELLQKHYGQKVIVLIDEYDVPLAKATENGYYEQMVFLIRNMFEQVLKTNEHLYFAVLTGCLRVSKEAFLRG